MFSGFITYYGKIWLKFISLSFYTSIIVNFIIFFFVKNGYLDNEKKSSLNSRSRKNDLF